MHRIFVYGTLKKGQCRESVMRGNFLGEVHTLPKYRLNNLGAFPGLTKEENGKSIVGELWEIDDDCLERLDRIEGHPSLFKREGVEIEGQEEVIAYFWQGETSEDCGNCWE